MNYYGHYSPQVFFNISCGHATPGSIDWCDHWKQCVWFVPGDGISISKGDGICLHATHTDTKISYNLKKQIPMTEILQHRPSDADLPILLSPERIAIYGDREWRLSMLKAVESVVSHSSLSFP